MRMRLVRLATIILRKKYRNQSELSELCRRRAVAFGFAAGMRDGGKQQAHTPEERGPRCRRRAQSLAPCAIVGSCTRCTCAAEPLVYSSSRDKVIAEV
jgi:hypothetical protein